MGKVIKVSRNIGLKMGEENGNENFENVFYNFDVKKGTAIEVTEKELKYFKDTMKRLKNVQEIIRKKMEG